MGLAEPRKRLKIAHDPNNVSWSQSTDSYGHRLMRSQGWKAGQRLGAEDTKRVRYNDNGRVAVAYKGDMLGLGAKLKSKDAEHSRAGLDAFQGLLGRLNGKSDAELKKEEQKVEDRKLAMWAQGKWGGMTFVPGGLLVQGEPFKQKDEGDDTPAPATESSQPMSEEGEVVEKAEKKEEMRRKRAEKKLRQSADEEVSEKCRKEERRMRRALESQVNGTDSRASTYSIIADKKDSTKPPETTKYCSKEKEKMEKANRVESPNVVEAPLTAARAPRKQPSTAPAQVSAPLRNGRSILRGKNIQAKKMAFDDAKMLDEIFMRQS